MDFKDIIKSLRNENNITQTKLAEMLSVSYKTVSHWETGYTEPSISQLKQLSKLFDISIDELVGNK